MYKNNLLKLSLLNFVELLLNDLLRLDFNNNDNIDSASDDSSSENCESDDEVPHIIPQQEPAFRKKRTWTRRFDDRNRGCHSPFLTKARGVTSNDPRRNCMVCKRKI